MSVDVFYLIAKIDDAIKATIEDIQANSNWKSLYSRWKSVHWLVVSKQSLPTKHTKIKILDITESETINDLAFANELEDSQLHRLIYQQELDFPGGEPFGILVGDFEPNKTLLNYINPLAESALVPFVTETDAKHLGLDHLGHCNHHNTFQNQFSVAESRFIVLGFPKIWLDQPQIWTNPAYLIALTIMHTFAQSGWFSQITHQPHATPRQHNSKHNHMVSLKSLTQVYLTDEQIEALAEIGIIGIKSLRLTQQLLFQYAITLSKQESLTHLLVACRFAHYLKVIMREKVGSFKTAEECEIYLRKWLIEYCADSADLTPSLAAKYPLYKAKVMLNELPGQPGEYRCQLFLIPHWQLARIETRLNILMRL